MKKFFIRKRILMVIIWIVVLTAIRIYAVNSACQIKDSLVNIGETLEIDCTVITPVDSKIITPVEFAEYFEADPQNVFGLMTSDEDKILYLKLIVKNNSSQAFEINDFVYGFGYGFESDIWCSSVVPELCDIMNSKSKVVIKPGEQSEAWLGTIISKHGFSNKRWSKLKEYDYYYVVKPQPNRVRIKGSAKEKIKK